MKYLIRIVSIIGLFSMAQLAYAVDLFQTGETLTADKLNDIDKRIMTLETTYAIGDIGPAGGWVFYVTGDGLHGLEAAPADQGTGSWGCKGTDLPGAEGPRKGEGARNTYDIIRGCPTGAAALLADKYVSPSGYFDWYLPAEDELDLMYDNIGQGSGSPVNVGGFTSNDYWSSSEFDADNALGRDFAFGPKFAFFKDNLSLFVRSVRVF